MTFPFFNAVFLGNLSQLESLCLTVTDRKHSSLVGGSAEEDKKVDKLGEEEDEEAPVEELRRCVKRSQNTEGGSTRHIPGVFPPKPPSPPLNPVSLPLHLPRRSPPQGTSACGQSQSGILMEDKLLKRS